MYTIGLVSVIVPIYNVELYVEECIESILRQTYKKIEIILVNDGSTDKSRKKIDKYLKDERCIIIDKENGGLSSARNAGLMKATGEYVYFVDSDDYLDERAVEYLVENMNSTGADFCCYRMSFVYENYKKMIKIRSRGRKFEYNIIIDNDIIIKDAFFQKNIKITAWSKIFRRNFIDKNNLRFYEGIINEDSLFTILCSIYAQKVSFLDKVLYFVRVRPGSISRNFKAENITAYYIVFREIKDFLEKKKIFEKYKNYYYGSYVKLILFSLIQCIFKTRDVRQYLKIYSLLNNSDYRNKTIGENIKHCSLLYFFLYKISLHPFVFYYLIVAIRSFGYKMY